MNNNPNLNNSFQLGTVNNNGQNQANMVPPANMAQPINNTSTPVNAPQQPVNNVPNANSVPNSTPDNNVVTLGTVSNVTYADTIGDIDYGTPINDDTPPVNNTPENFINTDYNDTSISDMNVEGSYNNMEVAPDYTTDPKVMAIIHPDKKNTVSIGKELKTFLLIAAVLLVFIFVLPILFELFNKIRFH